MTAPRTSLRSCANVAHCGYDAPVMHRAEALKSARDCYAFRCPDIRMKNARWGVFSVGADRKLCDYASRARAMALVACRICRGDLEKTDAPVMHGRFAGSGLCFARLGGPTRNALPGRVEPHRAQRAIMPLDRAVQPKRLARALCCSQRRTCATHLATRLARGIVTT